METAKKSQESIKKKNSSAVLLFVVATLCNALTWMVLYVRFPQSDDTVFLHYNIYFGVDMTGAWTELLWMPGTGAVVIVLNMLLLMLLRNQPQILTRLIAVMTILLNAGLFLALWLVINSNLA